VRVVSLRHRRAMHRCVRVRHARAFAIVLLAGCAAEDDAQPAASVPAASAPAVASFPDRPLGAGPCRFVSEREASVALGTAMHYRPVEPDDVACVLRPVEGGRPEISVTHSPDGAEVGWGTLDLSEDDLVPGIGDKAMVASSNLGGGSSMAIAVKGTQMWTVVVIAADTPKQPRESIAVSLLRAAVSRG